METTNSKFPLLDWLRFSAALMVVLEHSRTFSFLAFKDLSTHADNTLTATMVFGATRYGAEAVLIFFVLSGFLVGGATVRRLRDHSFSAGHYAADRVSRIMLPLAPAVVIAALVQAVVGRPPAAAQILGNLLSLQGVFTPTLLADVPLWSLTYEVWFYVLNGAVAVLIATRTARWAFAALCAASVVFSFLQLEYLVAWYLGALLYLCNDGRSSRAGLVFALIATAASAVCFELFRSQTTAPTTLALALAVLLLIRQLANWRCGPSAFSTSGLRLASFSYSLYLIHYPVLLLLARVLPRLDTVAPLGLALFGLRVAICLAAGWIFYLCFERHTPSVRRWLRGVGREGPARPRPRASLAPRRAPDSALNRGR
jgi:peptidoglycan/LPS O-acetylase OafA/YrhL